MAHASWFRHSIEWPTIGLAALIYGGWLAVTWWHAALPWWVVAGLGAWLVAWHGSLLHEILHGHPTRSRRFNHLLASIPLSLWLPYASYRSSHLSHHADDQLTDPLDDPESRYLTDAAWASLGPIRRWCLRAQKTLLGRVTLGPAWNVGQFLAGECDAVWRGQGGARRIWAEHALAVLPVVLWLVVVCRMNLGFYILAVLYPSVSLLLIRSFAEHKASDSVAGRTAIVERAWLLGPLFLFNNLHAAHHERPGMPWYDIPAWYRRHRARLVRDNGGLVYHGYLDVAWRHALTAHDTVAHPTDRAPRPRRDRVSEAFSAAPPASLEPRLAAPPRRGSVRRSAG